MEFKTCSKCMNYRLLTDFYNSKRSKDGKTSWCKECSRKISKSERNLERQKKYYHDNKDKVKQYLIKNKESISQKQKERVRKYKLMVLEHYGNKCECCGESRYEFLAIDHKNGGGGKMRKNKEHPFGGVQLYKWIVDNNYPNIFRILCHNCNLSIGFFGYCPHESST